MEDILRWSLLVVGGCVIVGVAVHGIWVSRKNSEQKPSKKKNKSELQTSVKPPPNEFTENGKDISVNFIKEDVLVEPTISVNVEPANSSKPIEPKFDDLGLSSVRVVSEPSISESEDVEPTAKSINSEKIDEPVVEHQSNSKPSKIYASVVTQPKPEFTRKSHVSITQNSGMSERDRMVTPEAVTSKTATTITTKPINTNLISEGYQAPEPPPFLLKKEVSPIVSKANESEGVIVKNTIDESEIESAESVNLQTQGTEKLTLTEQARNLVKRKKTEGGRKRREPKMAEDQMRIDFDDAMSDQTESAQPKENQNKQAKEEQPQEVLVLNVKSPEGESISGAALLPMLLTLGFKFGDQDIFHRHVNSNGKGPVLFSLANMFKPGVFDIDNLENFTTQGISLFMILPIEGEPHQVFNMMHNAARKISEEFSAQIYDAKRNLLTKQSLQQYVEKIREFERQRMLHNS